MGNIFSTFITGPLGTILGFIYEITKNYGFSIVLFTIFIKIILLPLAIKQQKSMVEMQKVQPIINDIQKKYKNDKEKMNKEVMKVYEKHKVNPAGGCFLLLIQFPIMIGLYQVIYRPLTHMIMKMKPAAITELLSKLDPPIKYLARDEITIINQLKNHPAINHLGELISNNAIVDKILRFNFNFFGLNLAEIPKFDLSSNTLGISPLWIIPLLAGLTTYLSGKYTAMANTSNQADKGSSNEKANEMQGSMTKIFPFMTLMFTFSLPSGVGLYWITSNIVQVIQQLFLNKYFSVIKKEGNKSK